MNKGTLFSLFIVGLLILALGLLALCWPTSTDSTTKLPDPLKVTKVTPPVLETPVIRPASQPQTSTPTSAPVAQLSERDKKYLRHGIDPSAAAHKISVTVTK